ncbi:hypothetical protein GCM10009663_33560 [Kitasatospora arboriphila]|uniref:Uncharacterized protein n=1 Tax=Kitasatospora arboriphila TaxID=258052 RepID=A0ABP4E5G9_9ACTN
MEQQHPEHKQEGARGDRVLDLGEESGARAGHRPPPKGRGAKGVKRMLHNMKQLSGGGGAAYGILTP